MLLAYIQESITYHQPFRKKKREMVLHKPVDRQGVTILCVQCILLVPQGCVAKGMCNLLSNFDKNISVNTGHFHMLCALLGDVV